MSSQEIKKLENKAKAGWRCFYQLEEKILRQDRKNYEILEKIKKDIKNKNIEIETILQSVQGLLDGLEERTCCLICRDNDLTKDTSKILSCLHRFHNECIKRHYEISRNKKCPICRT